MALQEVLKLVSDTADQRSQRNREEKRWEKETRRRQLLQKRRAAYFKGRRITAALEGIVAAGVIGVSAEMQKLIKEQGHPFLLWGRAQKRTAGYDMSDIYWRSVSRIILTAQVVRVENYGETSNDYGKTFTPDIGAHHALEFPYDGYKSSWRALIGRIASLHRYDLEEIENLMHQDKDWGITYSPEVLFDVLVQCSDQETLEELVRLALSE